MLDNEELRRRIVFALDHAKRGVQAAIAREANISAQAVTGWRATGTIDKAYLPILARLTGRKTDYFLDASVTDDASSATNEDDREWPSIIGFKQAAGLGNEREAEEWAEMRRLKFRADSLAKKRLNAHNLAVMDCAGDSMLPTLKDGDVILFDTSDTTPRNDKIYVLKVPGAGADAYNVKRCKLSKGIATFVADNPDGDHGWTPRTLTDPTYPIEVIGRVRWHAGWVK